MPPVSVKIKSYKIKTSQYNKIKRNKKQDIIKTNALKINRIIFFVRHGVPNDKESSTAT
jgi:hypothetical protein